MTLLVTGGAGFIGSNFILDWLTQYNESIITLDKLTYAGNLSNLKTLQNDPRHIFIHGDIADYDQVLHLLQQYNIRAIINFAAESHVDRSIAQPDDFILTNITGTFRLLEAFRTYCHTLNDNAQKSLRFLHVSTDEVFGSLKKDDPPFTELNRYQPNSPYSASKAAGDHLIRAYYHTYNLPVLTTNCSNNYGPHQFPEKLIPLCITNAISKKIIPIYGDGQQIRDWLYVTDHCRAIVQVLNHGRVGEMYNIGGNSEKTNLELVHIICDILDREYPQASGISYKEQIQFVTDRAGHDRRYAINSTKIAQELGWQPQETFTSGLLKTIHWYLDFFKTYGV